jgi:hypothetical protein
MRRLLLLAALAAVSCGARTPEVETMDQLRERVFSLAQVQTVYMDSLLPEGRCPRTFQGDTLVTSDIGWWTSGFYPGVLWLTYMDTDDIAFRDLAIKHTLPLAGLLDRETDHDIGFQLMSSFGKMAQDCDPEFLGGEGISPDSVLTRGAAALASRFLPTAGVIRSWDHGKWNFPVIIDNMMNLELLMDFGDREVAEKHALTTMKNHFREDGTCYHLVNYADDGTVLGKQTVQGFADESAWARGQAWALYGYAMMALKEKEAGNMDLADTFYGVAAKLEDWLLPRLPEDGVPFWDFSQTDYRDASAGAIIAGGLLKLRQYRGAKDDGKGLRAAERILRTLASPEYLAEPRTNGGFLLKHSVGHLPNKSEVDVPLTYADYYFLEALTLYPVPVN